MAYELVAEVLDHAPPDLTPAERLVMVVIAEYVKTSDYQRGIRRTSRVAAEIAGRAGLKAEGLKKALQRLAGRDLELRVPLSTGHDGRPVYATPGRSSTYQVPPLAAINGGKCVCDECQQILFAVAKVIPKGGSQAPLNGRKGGLTGPPAGLTGPPAGLTGPPAGLTGPPNRVPGSGSPGPRASNARSEPTDEDLETIIEEIQDWSGVTATADHARDVYRDVLGRAGTTKPRHPLSYVLKAIREEPHRYRPTFTPAPARQQPLLSLVEPTAKPVSEEKRARLAAGGWRDLARASPADADRA